MKISNVIFNITLFGSLILFTAAGLITVDQNGKKENGIINTCHQYTNLEHELDVLAAEELEEHAINFESVFGEWIEIKIYPEDISDVSMDDESIEYPSNNY
ncbi:hypothetical protein M0D21_04260 [Aquimarina sp. D1M17]|uniref:hypothetical protein n=1 Tax=Aquimarina acroporae TaxID=2937283 RepID=UPI0020BFE876|nr:hypothetical protein [Aquimarina acroporae]MCK8520762.1 hypothetical protein [Aquimarina acroporae]